MRKIAVFIGLAMLYGSLFAQDQQQKKPVSTMGLAGKYQYGANAEKEEFGVAYIYAESDSTILFFLDLNAGPPSLNMGSLYGRAKIKKGVGLFSTLMEDAEDSCKFFLKFEKDKLVLEAVDGHLNCGFGHGVYADGTFKRMSTKNPEYFLNSVGKKESFKDLKF